MIEREELITLMDTLSIRLHQAGRRVIYEHSLSIATDLMEMRREINEMRQRAGLGESPVEPMWDGEEDPNMRGEDISVEEDV